MAIEKEVAGENGITTSYHRVVRIDTMVNGIVLIETASYVNEQSRLKQKQDDELQAQSATAYSEVTPQYTVTGFYQMPYQDGVTASEAYAWLKANVPEFEGATDVWEEGQQGD